MYKSTTLRSICRSFQMRTYIVHTHAHTTISLLIFLAQSNDVDGIQKKSHRNNIMWEKCDECIRMAIYFSFFFFALCYVRLVVFSSLIASCVRTQSNIYWMDFWFFFANHSTTHSLNSIMKTKTATGFRAHISELNIDCEMFFVTFFFFFFISIYFVGWRIRYVFIWLSLRSTIYSHELLLFVVCM